MMALTGCAMLLACPSLHGEETGSRQPLTFYPLDQRQEFSASLNGTWKFKLGSVEGDHTAADLDDSAWKPIQVPGNWELQGFEEPLYRKPGDKDGVYRRSFTVSDVWKGRRVFLRFEGVAYAFTVFINGRHVGSFASAFNRSEFDITDFVEIGKPASLAVHVTRREKGWEFDTNDDWALCGIHRDVLLFSLPAAHVKDYTVTTPVSDDGRNASVRVKTMLENFAGDAARATFNAKVIDPQGTVAGSFSKEVDLAGNGTASLECGMPVSSPRLWTAETPNLYRLDLELLVAGKTVHQMSQRVGLRSTSITDGVYKLNGRPVKFRGINHHDLHPGTGRSMTREQYVRDLELMKAANINAIRMAHYPPQKVFLDLCDEYGMYVLDEVPFGFGEEHLTDDSYEENLSIRAEATVASDKNHTSVMLWTIGNENPYTPMVVRVAGLVKELDPSRSRCIAHPTGQYYFQPPPEVDILAPHYLVTRSKPDEESKRAPFLEDILKRPEITAPVLMTEYAHAAGTSMEKLRDCWEVMQGSDRFIGGCVWEFQDQGIYRKVPADTYPGLPKTTDTPPVEIGKVKAGTWVAPDLVLDTNGQEGADGIVDADRVPSSDYWAIRKIYSPVVIPVESLPVREGDNTLTIPIQNRYDFTDLSSVKGRWELHVDGHKAQSGDLTLQAAPHTTASAGIGLANLGNPAKHDRFLRFIFTDPANREIYQHTIRLTSDSTPEPTYESWAESASATPIRTTEQGPVVSYSAGRSRLQMNKETGEVKFGVMDQPAFAFEKLVLRVGRAAQMSEVRAYNQKGTGYWSPYLLGNPIVKNVRTGVPENGQVKVDLTLQFTRLSDDATGGDVSNQGFTADVHLTLSENGWLDVDYELIPVNATDHLLELGLAFQLPKTSTRLTWLGKGPYPVYPAQAEGMERGVYSVAPTAGFDAANRIYGGARTEVDIATAADDEGNGLGIVCRSGTVSLEPEADATCFTHILRSAGHGEKRSISSVNIDARELGPVRGSLHLLPLIAGGWPEPFKTVLSRPDVSSRLMR